MDGRRGEVARGVAEGVWSAVSTDGSCGVMGLGIPGMYPGSLGTGEA